MGAKTKIEWCDASWNPVRGCTRVSDGCTRCYAERIAARFSGPGQPYEGLARREPNGEARWTGKVRLVEEHLYDPLRWKKTRRIFVNSMSDLFHEGLTDESVHDVFEIMALCPQHQFQILTKRPERMAALLASAREAIGDLMEVWPLPNVWLGTSAENQATFDVRTEHLGAAPAAIRFVSLEPLLGPIDCGNAFDDPPEGSPYGKIHWVIVGGESGPGARPMHPDWARGVRDQCRHAGVPFFFKQWGAWLPEDQDGADYFEPARGPLRVGKKRAGRLLDGREWSEFPG